MTFYLLGENNIPEEIEDAQEWAETFERRRDTHLMDTVGPFYISTTFLGIDHRFGDRGPPLLWESMVFYNGPNDPKFWEGIEIQYRYSSFKRAVQGHRVLMRQFTRRYEQLKPAPLIGQRITKRRRTLPGEI